MDNFYVIMGLGIVTYVLGIFGINYLWGRLNPYGQMDALEGVATVLWPISIVAAIPVGMVIGIIIGIDKVAMMIRESQQEKRRAILDEERRQQQIARQVNNIDMFQDGPPINWGTTTFTMGEQEENS